MPNNPPLKTSDPINWQAALLQMVARRVPYAQHAEIKTVYESEKRIDLLWRHTLFAIRCADDGLVLGVEVKEGGMLCGSNEAILMQHLLKGYP